LIKFIFNILCVFLLWHYLLINGCNKNSTKPPQNGDPIDIPPGWELVWNDEFNAAQIDLSRWEHEVNGHGGGNNELQYYTDRVENSFIEDGKLVIRALRENYSGPDGERDYTSARLRTANKGDWKYGRFEIRAKLPSGQGLWPAIWMLPTDWIYGGWPASGEIDIMELLGQEPWKVYGTIHFGGPGDHRQLGAQYNLSSGLFSENFHEFAIEWEVNEIRWFVDDSLYATQNNWFSGDNDYPAPFDQRFHLLLNVAVGGNWPGSPDQTTIFPQRMAVDYVRVFKRKIN
jgi:beta-glucanase (GH16 family)